MEKRKATITQELIFEGILQHVPDKCKAEEIEVDKGKFLGYTSMEMTKRKDSGTKGDVAGTKGWADVFNMASRDLVQMDCLKEKKSLIGGKLAFTKAGLQDTRSSRSSRSYDHHRFPNGGEINGYI